MLVGISTVFALIVAVPLGVLQVVRRNKPIDYVLTGASFIFYAMPAFLLGELLILYFAIDLHWFPTEAPQANSTWGILSDPRDLVLPVLSLAALTIAGFSRYMRSSMMEAMTEDYIRTARAKGASQSRVLYRHALRNALIPIITLLGLSLAGDRRRRADHRDRLQLPGHGPADDAGGDATTTCRSCSGTTFVAAIATVAGSLLADVLYAIVDPRVRYALGGRHAWPYTPALEPDTTGPRRPAARRSSRSAATRRSQIVRVFAENRLAVVGVVIIVVHRCSSASSARSSTTRTRPTPRCRCSTSTQNAPPSSPL